jgi:uncharacterized damage-inducible protein DinB
MREHFIKLWHYTQWANERMMDALDGHPNGEGVRLINHIIGAQDEWLSRFDKDFVRTWELFDQRSLPECRIGNRHSVEGWISYLSRIDAATLDAPIDYKNTAGTPYRHVLKDLVAHGINHSTHHRAQIAMLIRQGGGTPPGTDYIYYLREYVG